MDRLRDRRTALALVFFFFMQENCWRVLSVLNSWYIKMCTHRTKIRYNKCFWQIKMGILSETLNRSWIHGFKVKNYINHWKISISAVVVMKLLNCFLPSLIHTLRRIFMHSCHLDINDLYVILLSMTEQTRQSESWKNKNGGFCFPDLIQRLAAL